MNKYKHNLINILMLIQLQKDAILSDLLANKDEAEQTCLVKLYDMLFALEYDLNNDLKSLYDFQKTDDKGIEV